ncbi:MAG: PAS domain-containing protein, partial [candidate division NC10 bacterium]
MNDEQRRSDRPGAGKRAEEALRRQRSPHPKREPTAAADKRKQETNRAQQLRQAAQEALARSKGPSGPTRQQTVEDLVYELEMHQIELEMQNEELRTAQLALEESRSGYADLYDFAPVGYFTISRTGWITAANLTGAALLGVGRQKLIHRGFGRFVAPEEIDRWDCHRLDALQQEGRVGCELALKREDGSPFYARLDSLRTATDDGSFALRTTVTDISERKRAEEELHRAKECLEVANR